MENQFLSISTWRGHVLVSACLLPPSVEESKEVLYSDRDRTQQKPPMSIARPPVPDFWNHYGQSKALINAAYGSDLVPSPPISSVTPSSVDFEEPCDISEPASPSEHSDSITTENSSPISPCWTPSSSSNCPSLADWDDAAAFTSPSSTAADSWSTSSAPFFDQHWCEQQQTQFTADGYALCLQSSSPPEDEKSRKRRRLSIDMRATQQVYNTRADLWIY
ncbi:hypothetical protein E4U13_003362 [Claviceps humidiphila]|uniref:Uncharacterized protein n=1 Tax=Claviceps humidiphila TaxID=1294629 RepID=A0A9P7PZX9_9HYPO|nr:hypothetical protein E4U13_003362 [Claviceps humidiphila]